ncbi:MAG: hypothetical protein KA007_02295 [Candidatus Pacebacteria bacterium]|jgi:hypothetical protein|nr:hypothetical protein [Candidatus Paceibacterota bacterium]
MISLIQQKYRRRMVYFAANLVIILLPIPLLIFYLLIEIHYMTLVCSFVLSFLGILRAFIKYRGDGLHNGSPWNIKKTQLIALNDYTKGGADFEKLRNSLPLQEYFFIK